MADMAGPAGGNRGGGGESSSSVGLSSTALLRVTRELKEVTRDPPNVLLGLKMDAGGSAPSRADETIDKDGRSVHRRGEVGAGNTVARTDEDAASGLMLLVIRGPDGADTYMHACDPDTHILVSFHTTILSLPHFSHMFVSE